MRPDRGLRCRFANDLHIQIHSERNEFASRQHCLMGTRWLVAAVLAAMSVASCSGTQSATSTLTASPTTEASVEQSLPPVVSPILAAACDPSSDWTRARQAFVTAKASFLKKPTSTTAKSLSAAIDQAWNVVTEQEDPQDWLPMDHDTYAAFLDTSARLTTEFMPRSYSGYGLKPSAMPSHVETDLADFDRLMAAPCAGLPAATSSSPSPTATSVGTPSEVATLEGGIPVGAVPTQGAILHFGEGQIFAAPRCDSDLAKSVVRWSALYRPLDESLATLAPDQEVPAAVRASLHARRVQFLEALEAIATAAGDPRLNGDWAKKVLVPSMQALLENSPDSIAELAATNSQLLGQYLGTGCSP